MRCKRWLAAFVLVVLAAGAAPAQDLDDPLLDEFVAAGEAYRDGRFDDAVSGYQALVLAGWAWTFVRRSCSKPTRSSSSYSFAACSACSCSC